MHAATPTTSHRCVGGTGVRTVPSGLLVPGGRRLLRGAAGRGGRDRAVRRGRRWNGDRDP